MRKKKINLKDISLKDKKFKIKQLKRQIIENNKLRSKLIRISKRTTIKNLKDKIDKIDCENTSIRYKIKKYQEYLKNQSK